jgi:hypothetical protein
LIELEDLALHCPKVTDEAVANLATLARLRVLAISSESSDGSGLVHVRDLRIKYLMLRCPRANDESILSVIDACPSIRTLDLTGCNLTDSGLENLGRYPQLRELCVNATKVTAEGIRRTQMSRPDIEFIETAPINSKPKYARDPIAPNTPHL